MKNTYTQCRLEKHDGNGGTFVLMSFIPSKFAIAGRIVKIKDCNDEWEDGWQVVSMGAVVDEDFLPDSHKAIKQHRKDTGDALPKK